MRLIRPAFFCLTAALTGTAALADPPEIVAASVSRSGMFWQVEVTLKHDDTGWDHFADAWRIEDKDGKVLAIRKLHHPHVDEQPFTRSLNNVMLPDGTTEVYLTARCSQDGWNKTRLRVPVGN